MASGTPSKRPKWGFSIPLDIWLKGDLRYLIEQNLSELSIKQTGIFNYKQVAHLTNLFLNNPQYKYLYNRIWLLIVMQKFLLNIHY
ncbi:MAG: asparagine synthase-related protein [Bacteroidales bacterium]